MQRFLTDQTYPSEVVIQGVGVLPAYGLGVGVSLDDAAQIMPELQDEQSKPLSGGALVSAAEKWAEGREGVVVEKLSDDAAAKRAKQAGQPLLVPGDTGRPPAVEVAQDMHIRFYGDETDPVNIPHEMVTGDATMGSSERPAPEENVQARGGRAANATKED